MKWVVFVVILASTNVASALLGLTAGINQNPEATVKFVPDWGSAADWVAGLGSLAAVWATVYFGWKQRQDLIPRLKMRATGMVDFSVKPPVQTFALKITNPGVVPVEVNQVFISSDNATSALWIPPGQESFPAVIGPGKGLTLQFDRHTLSNVKRYVQENCAGQNEGLHITISGSVRDFSIPLDPSIPKIA
ncbi:MULTISPECIES: hypothetical protein [Pseudomonas]|uniref:hypothetical protein n=1 Tax=Pseudomonas TaxID=286 RepID=UPI001AE3B110|nr:MULTISPECIES: hypothetical protein [Pseudomonas]MBP2091691.1 hypothetical protein [Pseudomonas sp. PvP088]MBP2222146.1 hypothetical protein [Pseudomonas putida]